MIVLPRVLAALAAVGLAAGQARTWWAEQAYERGLVARDPDTGERRTDDPTADLPGRLEAYLEAVRREPLEPLYALRAGQIELRRATTPPAPADRDERLARARTLLETASRLHPLEGSIHRALADVAAAARDQDEALRRTDLSVLLLPRDPATLRAAAQRHVRNWSLTQDPDALVRLIEVARLGHELADGRPAGLPPLDRIPGADRAQSLLLAPDGPGMGEVLHALRGRPELLDTAARLVESARPDDASRLRAAAESAR